MIDRDKKRIYEWNMYYGADNATRSKAKRLRAKMTKAELNLWEGLRKSKTGFKFRRQHPIGIYIVDFYCHELKLVIELDGGVHNNHNQKEWDKSRTHDLNLLNIEVIRFTNEEVFSKIDEVISTIYSKCRETIDFQNSK